MWLDVDDRSPARRRADEAIAREAERERPKFQAQVRRARAKLGGRRARSAEVIARVMLEGLIDERKKAGLTQVAVARRMGVPQSVIGRLESGAHSPTLTTLSRYAEAVGIRLGVLDVD